MDETTRKDPETTQTEPQETKTTEEATSPEEPPAQNPPEEPPQEPSEEPEPEPQPEPPQPEEPFYTSCLTEAGLALLTQHQLAMAQGEEFPFRITRAEAGEGFVSPSALALQTSVQDPIGEMELGPHEAVPADPRAVRLRVRLSSEAVKHTVLIRQVGIYAQGPDEKEILYQILQYRYDAPQPLASTAANYGALSFFESETVLVFANAKAAAIPQSPGWFLNRADLDAHDADPEAHGGRFTEILETIRDDQASMTAWQQRQDTEIQLLRDTLITDMEHKVLHIFDSTGGIRLIQGVYNGAACRLEC